VIIADGECQLERQRKLRPLVAKLLSEGKRTVRVKYGVDEDTCTGDHSCIRLSGCPTLTIKDNPDPLRTDPVATVIDGCVGCGAVRRERACGGAVSFLLPGRSEFRTEPVGPAGFENPVNLPERPITILIAALGGEAAA